MEPVTDKVQEVFFCKKRNAKIMRVGDTIPSAAGESGIDENGCLLDNKSTCNAFINGKYLSKIRDAPDEQYINFH